MSEHTRTARERAEELAAGSIYDGLWIRGRNAQEIKAFTDGFLARDAEPTTITAEQIEAAERRGAVKALKDAAMSVNLLVSTGMGLTPSELNLIDACASGAAQGWLMAQAARIEGDEA